MNLGSPPTQLRENMKVSSRVLVALIAAVAALLSVRAPRMLADNELSLVDGQGRTLTIQQWDTFLNGCSRWTATV